MNGVHHDAHLDFINEPQTGVRDAELISVPSTGSSDAFAELQRLYSRQLYCTIYRITRNREDAEDVLQDTLLRAYLALRNFAGRSSVYSWLARIAINSALMLLRKRRTQREVGFDFAGEREDEVPHLEPEDSCLNPEQICDQRERCANLHSAIERLEASLREPLQTRMTHGSSIEEIARTLDITEAAVKARLYRARTRLNATRTSKRVEERQHASSRSQRKMAASRVENCRA